MVTRRVMMIVLLAGGAVVGGAKPGNAQCCMSGLFAGCQSCFRKAPPAYAVAPAYAPIPAPVPVPAPPPPVMVPVQQVSYVPETTYQTKYECVPVTTYKPSCEIDPCTGCPVDCMQPMTSYQQRPVSVPVTQYRAVYSTKYVQMQPGYASPTAYPASYPAAAPGASPFAAPVQTSPQAWGAAGADVPQQLVPGQSSFAAPTLPPQTPPQSTFQQVIPQSGTYATPATQQPQLQPTAPPALAPTPSLKPIPEMPRAVSPNGQNGAATNQLNNAGGQPGNGVSGAGANVNGQTPAANATQPYPTPVPSLSPVWPSAAPAQGGANGINGMPVLPGTGPGPATGAFPKLLEPTGHTTQTQPMVRPTSAWHPSQPASISYQPPVSSPEAAAYASGRTSGGYPTAALPIRSQQ